MSLDTRLSTSDVNSGSSVESVRTTTLVVGVDGGADIDVLVYSEVHQQD